ncbi:MAG: hypothetical protein A4E58_02184 [Syntrophorhabdus sp. PtaB.Bin006]|nr:MAG: hypothetical protein A4E58_02184 [Syntrophorhabdus sp. PtaB.Bin006]
MVDLPELGKPMMPQEKLIPIHLPFRVTLLVAVMLSFKAFFGVLRIMPISCSSLSRLQDSYIPGFLLKMLMAFSLPS